MVNAPDHVALEACQQQLTDEQRRALDLSSRGPDGAKPANAGEREQTTSH